MVVLRRAERSIQQIKVTVLLLLTGAINIEGHSRSCISWTKPKSHAINRKVRGADARCIICRDSELLI